MIERAIKKPVMAEKSFTLPLSILNAIWLKFQNLMRTTA